MPDPFLNAKARGRRSTLHETDDLRALAAEASVGELAFRLYPRQDVRNVVDLEQAMLAAAVADLAGFEPLLAGARAALYRALLNRYPVENLKVLWRLYSRRGQGQEQVRLVDLPPKHAVPAEELMASKSDEEFVDRIPIPAVREAALAALRLATEAGAPAYVEMAFDKGYWTDVVRGLNALAPSDRAECAAPIETELDGMLLLAVLRAARPYQMPWEHLEALLPPAAGKLSLRTLRVVYEDPEPQAVADRIGRFGQLALTEENAAEAGPLEELIWREIVRRAAAQYRMTRNGFATLIGYAYLKRNEFRRMRAVANMVRYRMSPDEVAEQLGAAPGGGRSPR